jgi:hypothetical protein
MIKLSYVPSGLEEINDYYGNPDPDGDGSYNHSFGKQNLTVFNLPFPMRLGWRSDQWVQKAMLHNKVGLAVVDGLEEMGHYISGDPAYLDRNELNLWWGAFNFRLKRGYNSLSTHSWGIAFDINKHLGELGEPPSMPEWIVDIFEKRGFVWGGRWDRPDGMHFQACKGY